MANVTLQVDQKTADDYTKRLARAFDTVAKATGFDVKAIRDCYKDDYAKVFNSASKRDARYDSVALLSTVASLTFAATAIFGGLSIMTLSDHLDSESSQNIVNSLFESISMGAGVSALVLGVSAWHQYKNLKQFDKNLIKEVKDTGLMSPDYMDAHYTPE